MILTKQFFYNIKCTVTYNANGGSGSMTDSNSPYIAGSTVTVLNNSFTKSNSNFVEWNTKADGSGISYNPADTFTITEDTVLYALWVSYTSNNFGGINDDSDIEFRTLVASTTNGRPGYSSSISLSTFDHAGDASHTPFWCLVNGNGLLWRTSDGTYQLNVAFKVPDDDSYIMRVKIIEPYYDQSTGKYGYRINPISIAEYRTNGLWSLYNEYRVSHTFSGLTDDCTITCIKEA